eukprot:Sspe_Gene.115832::Locus_103976_Transcript_1_1_Confidence_1.000_Length_1301::g.115832::m.115832
MERAYPGLADTVVLLKAWRGLQGWNSKGPLNDVFLQGVAIKEYKAAGKSRGPDLEAVFRRCMGILKDEYSDRLIVPAFPEPVTDPQADRTKADVRAAAGLQLEVH